MTTPDRSMMHTTKHHRCGLLVVVILVLGCPGDDAVPSDGSGSGGSGRDSSGSTTAASTSTVGVTSTSSASSSSSSSSSWETADSTADSTGAPPPDACACAAPWPFAPENYCALEPLASWAPGCPDASPCPRLSVDCPRPGVDLYNCKSELMYDEAAMQCMLEVLRDGTQGRLEIDGRLHNGFHFAHPLSLLHVLEGRTAVYASCMELGSFGAAPYDEPSRYVLAEPGYFTECMAVDVPRERYDCMLDGLGEGTLLPGCPR
jgi:hypothetical protein